MTEPRRGHAGSSGAPSAIAGHTVVLRPVTAAHVPDILAVVTHPDVAKWWGGYDLARVRRELLGPQGYAIEQHGRVVGVILHYEHDDPDHRHASIDLALHPDAQGRGLGADAVRTLARHLVDVRGHHRLTIDPSVDNEGAVRCYTRVGFRRVGVMRRYERAPDGTWEDGLLMELLAEDLH